MEKAEPRPGTGGGRLTVQLWFLLVLVLMSVLVLVAAAVGTTLLGATAQASDRLVNRISPARIEAYRLQAALIDQETGVRGYMITGDRKFLEPYTRGLATEREASARLADLVQGERQPAADLRAVLATGENWRRDYATVVIAHVQAHGPGPVAGVTEAHGKNTFDTLRAQWTVQDRHLTDALTAGRADLAHNRTVRDWAFIAMLAVFLLTGVLLAVLLHFTVARPLNSLRITSRQVAGGDFARAITGRGPADLRAVAADVEAMRRQMVAELDSAAERERLLQRQAADLDDQATELRRSNNELEQFAYVASHDLQEPLRKVASFCQMLERRYGDQLDERGSTYIAYAVDGAKRMQLLINDLLAFSRVGRLTDEHRPVSLDHTLDKALTNLDAALTDTDARIERSGDLPEIVGDPTLLTMVWQNLVGNAIKFRAVGRTPVVRISCAPEHDHWLLTVTDNGIGIPPEFAEKIFVIFQRLHNRESYSGTGIGLSLCKKIVEYHGGRIWLDTEHTEGTRLRFTIPRTGAMNDPSVPATRDGTDTGTDTDHETGVDTEAESQGARQ